MPTTLHEAIKEAVTVLRDAGVVAFPTDTLYGLGADIFNPLAVKRIFDLKGRLSATGLPVLVASNRGIGEVAVEVPEVAWKLVERFWPGPLTLVLKKSHKVPLIVTGAAETIAVRMPDHDIPRTLVQELGRPITGTSANPSGGPDPITADDVKRTLGDRVDYILDGGPAFLGLPSTIVDLAHPVPRLIRLGAIDEDAIRSCCSMELQVT